MKSFKFFWLALLIMAIGLSAGCAKKVIRSEAIPSPAMEASKCNIPKMPSASVPVEIMRRQDLPDRRLPQRYSSCLACMERTQRAPGDGTSQ